MCRSLQLEQLHAHACSAHHAHPDSGQSCACAHADLMLKAIQKHASPGLSISRCASTHHPFEAPGMCATHTTCRVLSHAARVELGSQVCNPVHGPMDTQQQQCRASPPRTCCCQGQVPTMCTHIQVPTTMHQALCVNPSVCMMVQKPRPTCTIRKDFVLAGAGSCAHNPRQLLKGIE
jgi:hypothetical protein